MWLFYVFMIVLGVALFHSAENIIGARRVGPITEGERSSETGGDVYRLFALLLIGIGLFKLVQLYVL